MNHHINNPHNNIHINYNDNDDSKVEQDIIEQLYPDPDKMTYEQLLELEEKVGNVNKGLNEEKIKKIPFITFKKGIYQDCDKCIICKRNSFMDILYSLKVNFSLLFKKL